MNVDLISNDRRTYMRTFKNYIRTHRIRLHYEFTDSNYSIAFPIISEHVGKPDCLMLNSQLSRKRISLQRQPYYNENSYDNKDNAQWPTDLERKPAGPMSANVFWRTSEQCLTKQKTNRTILKEN